MRVFLPCCVAVAALGFLFSSAPLLAQSVPAGQAAPATQLPSRLTQPALDQVQQALSSLNLSKWKTKDDVREATFQNISSIQRDIENTLPGLSSQADSAPGAIQPSFALYRNLDALYDVLLRVSGTASIVGSQADASAIENALAVLESARKSLGDRILDISHQQEVAIVKLQAEIKAVPVAPVAQAHGTVIDDGPKATPRKKRRRAAEKPKSKPPITPTATPPAQPNH